MIQRVRSQTESLLGQGAIAETDPMLLEEMVALVVAQGLDVVSLSEAHRRLTAREFTRRFVCFTFDGAYQATLASVSRLFQGRGLPFTLFVAADFVDSGAMPWWIVLESLIIRSERITAELDANGQQHLPCRDEVSKRACYTRLYRSLAERASAERAQQMEVLCRRQGVDIKALAAQEMLSGAELKALAADPLVTLGSQAGGLRPLAELTYDEAKDDLSQSLDRLETVLGNRPRHLAYPGAQSGSAGIREFRLAAALGIETAVTAVEGALWPEHAGDPFALPRIALDNDPATLVRALMLSGGTPFAAGAPTANKASA